MCVRVYVRWCVSRWVRCVSGCILDGALAGGVRRCIRWCIRVITELRFLTNIVAYTRK